MAVGNLSGQHKGVDGPEQRLWRAVLLTALRDAAGVVYSVSGSDHAVDARRHCVHAAIAWFERGGYSGGELALVCGMADVDAAQTRAAAMQAIRFRWGDNHVAGVNAAADREISRKHLKTMVEKAGWGGPVVSWLLEREGDPRG